MELLDELPAAGTALGATEVMLLNLIFRSDVRPDHVFLGHKKANYPRAFGYWEIGQMLDWLAHCPAPAVLGLEEESLDIPMHRDRERYRRYTHSKLKLSNLGRTLAEERADFSRHNPIRRWWGGTELTNDRLWRWESANKAMILTT